MAKDILMVKHNAILVQRSEELLAFAHGRTVLNTKTDLIPQAQTILHTCQLCKRSLLQKPSAYCLLVEAVISQMQLIYGGNNISNKAALKVWKSVNNYI